jgi:hypothetical protein
MLKHKAYLALALFGVISLSACGVASGDEPASPKTNWDAPLIDGVSQPSVAAAQGLVRFKIVSPAIGTPALIQVDSPAQMPENERTVAFVFHTAAYGTVVVEESEQGDWTLDRFRARASAPVAQAGNASSTPGPGLHPFQMVPVRKTSGLLATSGEVGSIMWIENGVLFRILGPSVTTEQVQKLAAQF